MKIKLLLREPRSDSPLLDLIVPDDPHEALVVRYLWAEVGSIGKAREFRDQLKRIMAGTEEPSIGSGERFYEEIDAENATIARAWEKVPDPVPEPTDVTLPTADLLDVVEQWLACYSEYRR